MNKIEFYIEKTYPRHGSVGFSVNDVIKIIFMYHMQRETMIDQSRIQLLSDGKVVQATNKYSPITKTLEILPSEPLAYDQDYIVKIYSGEKGPLTVKGEELAQDSTYVFTTEKNPTPKEEPDDPEGIELDEPDESEEAESDEGEETEIIDDPFNGDSTPFYLVDSYPKTGDLLEVSGDMVFVFNEKVSASDFNKNVFIKKSSMNKLVETLRSDELIKGSARTPNEESKSKQIIFAPEKGLLKTGQEYQLVIKKELNNKMNEDIRITFHTLFDRMFADVSTVRLVLGRFADRLSDLELAKLINQQSNSIYQLASMMDTFSEDEWVDSGGIIVEFPYPASQYVVYSTAYYAILGQSLETSSGISETIKLADLSVSGSNEVSDSLSDLLDSLRKEIDRWWNVLQGEPEEIEPGQPNPNYSMRTTIRAGATSPYPDFHTRVPFEDIGGGGG